MDCGRCLRSRRAGDAHLRLHIVNCINNVSIAVDAVICELALCGIQSVCIVDQALHFLFCAAVAKLQVVQHGIVLLGKSLIGVLNRGHVRAHFVGVVGHIRNSRVRLFRCHFCVAAKGLEQRRRKACHGVHVLISRHTGRFVCICGVLLHLLGASLEKRVNAADKLFIVGIFRNSSFCKHNNAGRRRANSSRRNLSRCCECFFCFFRKTADGLTGILCK